jgi:hypothetical protein
MALVVQAADPTRSGGSETSSALPGPDNTRKKALEAAA